MDATEGTSTEDLWTPYKELVAVVEGYLAREGGSAPYAVHTFEAVLRRHKQTFLSLLKNPTKNPTSRDEIRRGITEGVNLPSIGRTLLSKELVDEAIIISDMYNVNEYLSLELLHTATRQAPRHPGLPRGLVAVLLYYDGRASLVRALKELVMASDGVSWSISAREEVIAYVTRYVDQLITDGLLGNTLDALKRLSLPAELELMQNNRALPPRKHHKRLLHTIESTRKLLAGVIFSASAQRGLGRDTLLRVLSEESTSPSQGPTGALDDISLALQMALLYALDLSVLHRREDGEELSKKLPLIQDPNLISVLLDELSPPVNPNQSAQDQKTSSGVRALCQLALGLALAALRRAPQSLQRPQLLDQDEALVEAAIDGKVFEYIDEAILSNEQSVTEEYYQRRLHSLITDFVVLMHSKLMEMRVKADEAARAVQMYAAEGLAPPVGAGGARTRFDALLRCVTRLYAADPLQLRKDYWMACETTHSTNYRSGGRAATLYKFVRLSGELVPPPLLGGYLVALASLCVPRHTWALLASERAPPLSAHHLLTALHTYRDNLRSDPAPFSDQMHASSLGASAIVTPAARPGRLMVRQEEVEAMIAALKLIAAVAEQDQAACLAICENLQWDAVNVMFGLVCCQVPLQLKAQLVTTLGALGGWPGCAGRVWAALEAAQLVVGQRRGLRADLLEVECRIEEYPLSRAFLSLLTSLTRAAPLPLALGCGAREGGIAPYCSYVLTELALPAPHRPAVQPSEKWQVLALSLNLLALWLDQYEPNEAEADAVAGAGSGAGAGRQVALQLQAESELLRLLLSVLHEAGELLYTADDVQQPYVEQCLTSTLQLLERGLAIERAMTQSSTCIGLSKLLMASDNTGKDHMVGICLVLEHGATVPRAAQRAVAALCRLGAAPAAARRLLHAAAASPRQADIRHGFVECLEAEEWAEPAAGAGSGAGAAARQCKEGVVQLLQQLLPHVAPNFAHFLLGYQLTEDISRSALHEPGVSGSPRTCLHSVLDILDKHIAGPDNADREASNLVEGCYRLVYWLCARPNTSGPLLRLLRARDNFLVRHAKATVNLETASVATISSRSWVLRACACSAGSAARHHASLAALLAALTQPQQSRHDQEWQWCLIRRALEAPVTVSAVPEPRWELFHADQLRKAVAMCDLPTGMGGKRISVTRLHAVLSRELASVQATAPQRNMLALEIQKVLDYVTEVNRQRNLAATLTHYYDSWRQLTEILFCVAPPDLLSLEARKTLLLNILQDLLNKIPPAEVLPQIGNLASGTVLLLLVNLRHCYILQKRESNLKSADFESTFFGPSTQLMQSKSLILKFILHKILSWILVSGGSTQKMRVNLYGALLNYLNIVNLKTSPAELTENDNDTFVSRLDSSKGRQNKEESALKSMVIDVISGFGDNLCSIVCSDCISGGHDVCRMVALSCLDTLIEIYPQTEWMNTLTNQGYLRSLIDSLLQDDEGLKQALEPNPKTLRVLYVYESKMALLTKISSTRLGAETVLAQGALACLASLRALSCHPDVHAGGRDTQLLPPVAHRFRQILVPALALCGALLTALGTENHSCVLHVTHFLISHQECIDVVLRAAHPDSPEGLLIELEAITSVIGRASNREVFGAVQADTALHRAEPALQRVRALLLALLPRFVGPPKEEDSLLYYKIVCNILTYCRNILSMSPPRALFAPSLGGAGAGDAPPAGALLTLLGNAVRRCHAQDKLLATTLHHLGNVATMTIEDMKKLLPSDSTARSPVEVRAAAVSHLSERAESRRQQAQYCRSAVSQALHLAWATLHALLRASAAPDTALTPATAIRGAYGDQLSELKKGVVGIFNDRFVEELLDTAKNQPPAERGFLEVLIKDIKSMIQFTPL